MKHSVDSLQDPCSNVKGLFIFATSNGYLSKAMHDNEMTFSEFRSQLLEDYRIVRLSRECSLLGRKEVLLGRAKFGIFGDGKELPQIALSKFFKPGDYRS